MAGVSTDRTPIVGLYLGIAGVAVALVLHVSQLGEPPTEFGLPGGFIAASLVVLAFAGAIVALAARALRDRRPALATAGGVIAVVLGSVAVALVVVFLLVTRF